MVIDPLEAWIFHVLPDSTGSSAIYVAQQIPPTNIASVMNAFVIRAVDLNDGGANFMYSSNLEEEATFLGWEGREAELDFSLLFSGENEATCKYSSGRRMWTVMNRFAPSLSISPNYSTLLSANYPTSFTPDVKVNSTSFRSMMRDTFEGTEFSLSGSLEAYAPFSSASRWVTPQTVSNDTVCWERSISTYRSIVSFVAEARGWLPDPVGGLIHFTPHSARAGLMLPLMVGMKSVTPSLSENSLGTMNRGSSSFWGARVLYNLVELKSAYMIEDVRDFQRQVEDGFALNLTQSIELEYSSGTLAMSEAQVMLNDFVEGQVQKLWDFGDTLLMNYADGYCTGCGRGPRHLGYPQVWLDAAYPPQ